MEHYAVLCVLVVCSVLKGAQTCQGPDVESISQVLRDVRDWKGLANWLNIKSNDIETNCARDIDTAACYRRELVHRYCDSQPFGDPSKVAEDIAKALEQMNHKRQAQQLRELEFEATSQVPHHVSSNLTITSSSSILPISFTVQHMKSPCIFSPSPLTRYADYLKDVYATSICRDKWSPTPGKIYYIKLTLVKKEKVSQEETDHFTRLTLQGDIGKILVTKQPIAMEDIFKDNNTRLVVVEGAPGIGKSTLTCELCRQWPTLESLKRFSLVVLLRLREESVQTATTISDLFSYLDDPDVGRCVGEEVGRRMGEGVLLVFDGFDEFPAQLRKKSLVAEVIRGSCLPKATVLVASRPSATAEFLSVYQARVDKHIEIVGFSDKEIQEYAESEFGSDPELLANFRTYLRATPVVRGLMYNPLNCVFVVKVYRESYQSHRPIPHTQTQLYTELSLYLLSRHLRADEHPMARKLPDRLEDIPHDSDIYQQLVRLGRLAFEGIVRNKFIFKQLPDGCSTLGLLNTYSELYKWRENVKHNFLHITLQEYLGAFYISQLPASEQRKLFLEHKYLNMVWRFVAGLTRMQAIGWEGFRGRTAEGYGRWKGGAEAGSFREYATIRLRSHMGGMTIDRGYVVEDGVVRVWPSVVHCLYEAQDAGSYASVLDQSQMGYFGSMFATPIDAYAVGYCISRCRNYWNVSLIKGYNLGPEIVEMLMNGLQSVKYGGGSHSNYGGGSVEELVLSYNHITDEGMKYLQQFPRQILQQMKTLSLSYCDLGQVEFDLLAETLPLLKSLESLYIFGNPGGSGSAVKLLQALEKHGKVELLHMDDIVIGRNDAMVLSNVVQSSKRLRELTVSMNSNMSQECVQQFLRQVLSPSSLRDLVVYVPLSISPLDHIQTISDNLKSLKFVSPTLLTLFSSIREKKLSYSNFNEILVENATLKVLVLLIPLGEDEVRAIVKSLKHNHSITVLRLSDVHLQYFSMSELQTLDHRIEWVPLSYLSFV